MDLLRPMTRRAIDNLRRREVSSATRVDLALILSLELAHRPRPRRSPMDRLWDLL